MYIYTYIHFSNGTKAIVDELKPFSLYHFKVRSISYDPEESSIFSDSVECYTVEDGKEQILNRFHVFSQSHEFIFDKIIHN